MKSKKMLAAAIGAGIAPLLAVSLPAGSASAHGYISSPPAGRPSAPPAWSPAVPSSTSRRAWRAPRV